MKHTRILAALLAASMLTACTEPNGAPGRGIENGGALSKTDVGTAVGVVGGGLVGSAIGGGAGQVVAIIGGGLLGGFLGNQIGQSLDNADRARYDSASQQAMETGQSRAWSNHESGHHGRITPHKRYRNDEGQYCRQYTQTIYVDGKARRGKGTACRQQDGTWKIVE
jgi:surface antigen